MQEEMFQLLNFKSKAYDWMLKSNLANFQKYQILIFTYKCRNRFNKNASLSNEESEETKCGLIMGKGFTFRHIRWNLSSAGLFCGFWRAYWKNLWSLVKKNSWQVQSAIIILTVWDTLNRNHLKEYFHNQNITKLTF